MTKPQQLVLDLPLRAALGRDDFLLTNANAAAVALIDQWPKWPSHGAILVGPEGAGKSHLAQVWLKKSGAQIIDAIYLKSENIPQLLNKNALCIENLESKSFDENALFHALNLARQEHGFILMTARQSPLNFDIKLPDLRSRLNALPIVHILSPDDQLLRGVLVKLFADRQINVDEALINFMILRMPRSLAAARQLVEYIDTQALIEKAEITRTFVSKLLAEYLGPDLFTTD
jgi:chromosomal replication initiation ATPase DnaA